MIYFQKKLKMKEVRFSKETEAKDEELSPEKAALLYKEGGFYIVKDLIPGSEFGCDMKSWNTGKVLRGIAKNLSEKIA